MGRSVSEYNAIFGGGLLADGTLFQLPVCLKLAANSLNPTRSSCREKCIVLPVGLSLEEDMRIRSSA